MIRLLGCIVGLYFTKETLLFPPINRLPGLAILIATLTLSGCGSTETILHEHGVKIRVYTPSYLPGQLRSHLDPDGVPLYHQSWGDGQGNNQVEFQIKDMRLWVDGEDYGQVKDGDEVEIYYGKNYVNGELRSPVQSDD